MSEIVEVSVDYLLLLAQEQATIHGAVNFLRHMAARCCNKRPAVQGSADSVNGGSFILTLCMEAPICEHNEQLLSVHQCSKNQGQDLLAWL